MAKVSDKFLEINPDAVRANLWQQMIQVPPEYPTHYIGNGKSIPLMQAVREDYKTLGLPINGRAATYDEIKSAYRNRAKTLHPDPGMAADNPIATPILDSHAAAFSKATDAHNRLLDKAGHETASMHELALEELERKAESYGESLCEFNPSGWISRRNATSGLQGYYFPIDHLDTATQDSLIQKLTRLCDGSHLEIYRGVTSPYDYEGAATHDHVIITPKDPNAAHFESFYKVGIEGGEGIWSHIDHGTTIKGAMQAAAAAHAAGTRPWEVPADHAHPAGDATTGRRTPSPRPMPSTNRVGSGTFPSNVTLDYCNEDISHAFLKTGKKYTVKVIINDKAGFIVPTAHLNEAVQLIQDSTKANERFGKAVDLRITTFIRDGQKINFIRCADPSFYFGQTEARLADAMHGRFEWGTFHSKFPVNTSELVSGFFKSPMVEAATTKDLENAEAALAKATKGGLFDFEWPWSKRSQPTPAPDAAANIPKPPPPPPPPKAQPRAAAARPAPTRTAPRQSIMERMGVSFEMPQMPQMPQMPKMPRMPELPSLPRFSIGNVRTSYSRPAVQTENSKAALTALGVGAAAAGGWALYELSKRDQQEPQSPDIAPH